MGLCCSALCHRSALRHGTCLAAFPLVTLQMRWEERCRRVPVRPGRVKQNVTYCESDQVLNLIICLPAASLVTEDVMNSWSAEHVRMQMLTLRGERLSPERTFKEASTCNGSGATKMWPMIWICNMLHEVECMYGSVSAFPKKTCVFNPQVRVVLAYSYFFKHFLI